MEKSDLNIIGSGIIDMITNTFIHSVIMYSVLLYNTLYFSLPIFSFSKEISFRSVGPTAVFIRK